ncbi:hypothetical protein GCM10023189_22000 [Nibrella saemangeumensis]|uniref:Uncharacterized protein n=1 Tax=Nibrella saemangeumensis TaxID=1084526 RepID=A0ABP8MU55_9BACT
MRHNAPRPEDMGSVPSGMDFDPRADEEVIDQQAGGSESENQYPAPADQPVYGSNQTFPNTDSQTTSEALPGAITPENDLSNAIAYALDGSGPGPTGNEPTAPERKVITEGVTGAGPEEEEENLRDSALVE